MYYHQHKGCAGLYLQFKNSKNALVHLTRTLLTQVKAEHLPKISLYTKSEMKIYNHLDFKS